MYFSAHHAQSLRQSNTQRYKLCSWCLARYGLVTYSSSLCSSFIRSYRSHYQPSSFS